MALVISISYSVSHANFSNLTIDNATSFGNLGGILRLGLSSDSHAFFNNITSAKIVEPDSILVPSEDIDPSTKSLSREEYMQGLRAGEQAMRDHLYADAIAARSPLQSPSPESRHRYAVNTCANISVLTLAAVGEIAATRKIEDMRWLEHFTFRII